MTPATLSGPASASAAAARRRRPTRGGGCDESPRLFGDEPVVSAPAVASEGAAPVAATTLADLVADTWTGLTAAAGPVPCLACGAELQPRWSAGSGVVGGRCDGCGATLE